MKKITIEDHCWHIVLNTNANEKKSERNWRPIAQLLARHGIRHELHVTHHAGEGIETARQLCNNGIRHLVAAGGDGTINEVVNGIFTSGADPREVYMTVLPLGRGNDWVRTHLYPQKIEQVVELWLQGSFMQHDVGRVTTFDGNRQTGNRYFLNIAGFGFDADVIYDVTHHTSHLFRLNTYVLSLIKTLFSHKPTPVEISTTDGFRYEGNIFMVIAAICQYNGGGIREAKYAVPDDGRLDLIVVPEVGILRVVKNLKEMFSGDHIDKIKEIRKALATEVTISSPQLLRGETEGELLAFGNYHIELIPNSLNVLSNRPLPTVNG